MKKIKKINFQKYLFYLLAILFAVSMVRNWLSPVKKFGPDVTGLPAPMEVFHSSAGNIVFDMPQSWSAYDLGGGNHGDMEVIIAGGPRGGVLTDLYVIKRTMPALTSEEAMQWAEMRLADQENYHLISLENTELGYFYEYSYGVSAPIITGERVCKARYTLETSGTYGISCCTAPKIWPEVQPYCQKILESFEVR